MVLGVNVGQNIKTVKTARKYALQQLMVDMQFCNLYNGQVDDKSDK